MQFDPEPSPEPRTDRALPSRWESWAVLAGCVALVLLGFWLAVR